MPVIIVLLRGRELKRVPIVGLTTTVGRDKSCDITIDNPALSRHHATIEYMGSSFGIRDEVSANGIFKGGKSVSSTRLEDGEQVAIGKFRLKLLMADGPPVWQLTKSKRSMERGALVNPNATMAIELDDLERMTQTGTVTKGTVTKGTVRKGTGSGVPYRKACYATSPRHSMPLRTLPQGRRPSRQWFQEQVSHIRRTSPMSGRLTLIPSAHGGADGRALVPPALGQMVGDVERLMSAEPLEASAHARPASDRQLMLVIAALGVAVLGLIGTLLVTTI
ncbi:MAG: FHA domain-containing protein [Myxococcales bacterium]|nr:FHA domain-containing protein [Myxococcales bacterium]